jgi:hypothetical protein
VHLEKGRIVRGDQWAEDSSDASIHGPLPTSF